MRVSNERDSARSPVANGDQESGERQHPASSTSAIPGVNIEFRISTRPWDTVDADAFVVPTNSTGSMDRHPAAQIRELCGPEVERELVGHTPLAIGAALVTSAGRMRARHLIHVANTHEPGAEVLVESIRKATAAALVACVVKGFTSVAIPLMGAFSGGIPAVEAARAIFSELGFYGSSHPLTVVLVANGDDEVGVFSSVAVEPG